jgi:hypothetical protein
MFFIKSAIAKKTASLAAILLAVPFFCSAQTEVKLTSGDLTRIGTQLGKSIAVRGNTVVIGSYSPGGEHPGAVYIFEQQLDTLEWRLVGKHTAESPQAGDKFGYSVALDGNTLLVGSLPAADGPGSVHVFQRQESGWSKAALLEAPEASLANGFGASVTIRGDMIAVGAPGSSRQAFESGQVYVFERDAQSAWKQTATVNPAGAVAGEHFGSSVAFSAGNLIAGATGTDSRSASLFVFGRGGEAGWNEITQLKTATSETGFGASLAATDNYVVASVSGAAYVFARNYEDGGRWAQASRLSVGDGSETFGSAVSISGDTIAIGASGADALRPDSGAVYLFNRKEGDWALTSKLTPTDGSNSGGYGLAVSVSDKKVAVAALSDSSNGRDAALSYVSSATAVQIDVNLSKNTNVVNLKSSNIDVAVLSSATFDATKLDYDTVTFGPGLAKEIHRPPTSHLSDVNGDKRIDAVFHFDVATARLRCPQTTATLMGNLNASSGGTTFEGIGAIDIIGCKGDKFPVAVAQSVTTAKNTAKVITLTGTDADSDPLKFFILTASSHGTLSAISAAVCSAGTCTATVTYTPTTGYFGTDSFVFQVDDGVAVGSATVSITVTGNTAPTASATPPSLTINEDAGGTSIALNGSDAETTAPNLRFTITQAPTNGTLKNGGATLTTGSFVTGSPASLTYQPNADYFGSDSFRFKVTDRGDPDNCGAPGPACSAPGESPEVTVAITINSVNDAPGFDLTASPNQTVINTAGPQSVSPFAMNLTKGPANESTQALTGFTVTGNTNPALFSAQPAISVGGALTYTPAANANGTATITVVLQDDGGTANGGVNTSTPRTFTITVTPPNQPPTSAAQPNVTTNEDAAVIITLSATDTDSASITAFSVATGPTNGALGPISAPTCTPGGPPTTCTATVTYTTNANYFGGDSLTFTATDGLTTSAPATVSIAVNAVNDAPSFTKGADVSVLEDSAAYSASWATAINVGPANESTQTITFNIGSNTNASLFSVQPAVSPSGVLTFTLAPNASGAATVTVTAQDAGGTANGGVDTTASQQFTITVNDVNDVPSFTIAGNPAASNEDAGLQTVANFATAISAGPNETQNLTFMLTANSNPTLFAGVPSISSTGVLTYTAAPNANGTATISFLLKDDGGAANGGADTSTSQQFTITITAVNDPPSFTLGTGPTVLEDSGAHSGTQIVSTFSAGPPDETGQTVTFTVSGNTNSGFFSVQPTIDGAGNLTFTPAANAFGAATISVTASDGTDTSAAQTFIIAITGINDAPSFVKGSDQTVNEDSGAQSVPTWATSVSAGPNESGQVVSFVVTGNTNSSLFSAGPTVGANGTLTYTPAANQNGTATITLKITDNGGVDNGGVNESVTQSFAITVNAVNDPPTVTDKLFAAHANMPIDIGAGAGLLTGVADANDNGINGCVSTSFTITPGGISSTSPAGGLVVANADGSFRFTPPPGFTGGNVSFTYTVTDTGCPGTANSLPATVAFTVSGPVIWFVNSSAPAGNGTLLSPFNTLAGADAVDAADHRIFLSSGTYTSGISLNAGEWLIGQGVTGADFDTLFAIAPPIGTLPRPTLAGARPSVTGNVVMAGNGAVRGLNIQPASGTAGLGATGATGLNVSEVNVTTTNAVAVSFVNSDGTFSFTRIDANGGTNGIVWNNTSAATGSFTVAGSGGTCTIASPTCTGGTVQNTTEDGIVLNNTRNVSLTHTRVLNAGRQGLWGKNVNGFTLKNSLNIGAGDGDEENGILFENDATTSSVLHTGTALNGTFLIRDVVIDTPSQWGLRIHQNSGTANVTLQRLTVQNNYPATFGEHAVSMNIEGSGTANVLVDDSDFLTVNAGLHGNAQGTGGAVLDLTVQNTIVNQSESLPFGINFTTTGSATGRLKATGNTLTGCTGTVPTNMCSLAIDLDASANSTLEATIQNNTISNTGIGGGIEFIVNENAIGKANISGNTITVPSSKLGMNFLSRTISTGSNQTGQLHLTLANNTVSGTNTAFVPAFAFAAGASGAANANLVCLNLGTPGATVNGTSGTDVYAYTFRMRTGTTFQIQGLTGSGTDRTNVMNFVNGKHGGGTLTGTAGGDAGFPSLTDVFAPGGSAPGMTVVSYTNGTCQTPADVTLPPAVP